MAKNQEGCAIGIDLGTTYSCVAVWHEEHGRVEIIHNDQGNKTTPSFVAFAKDERFIGDSAKNQAAMNPENTVFGNVLFSTWSILVYNLLYTIEASLSL